ncbi:MAG: glycosyltransferase family 39 protein [Deltaproteobacteria bacterium]|nr:glycosyltransferase family 39 protein [Desulfitobacteriaceae bacterium]MDI6854623.1 glycosyltransferase family 39 protein [Deltaproteobacteria bacterium]
MRDTFLDLIILTLASSGFILALCFTSNGVGIQLDGTVYISSARNLINSSSLKTQTDFIYMLGDLNELSFHGSKLIPLTHFPPLFPALLALIGISGIDPLIGARWLNAFIFGANIILIALIIKKASPKLSWSPVLGSLLVLFSSSMLIIHCWANSEPIFILLGFIGLYFLNCYIEDHKTRHLPISALFIALAFLARFTGIIFVLTAVFSIYFLTHFKLLKKLSHISLYAIICCLPVGLWLLSNIFIAESATNRSYHISLSIYKFLTLVKNSFQIFLPMHNYIMAFLVICFILLIGLISHYNINFGVFLSNILVRILFIFICSYTAFIIFSLSFLDNSTPIDDRILLPLLFSQIVLLVLFFDYLYSLENKIINLAIVWFIVLLLSVNFLKISKMMRDSGNQLGFNNISWKTSQLIKMAKEIPKEIDIYSNGPDALYLINGRIAYTVPKKYSQTSRLKNNKFEEQVAKLKKEIDQGKAAIIYFTYFEWRRYLLTAKELEKTLAAPIIKENSEGKIYGRLSFPVNSNLNR